MWLWAEASRWTGILGGVGLRERGGGFSRGVLGSFSFVPWGKNSTLFPFHASGHACRCTCIYTYIFFFFLFASRSVQRVTDKESKVKGNERSAGIRPGEPSPTGTFHSERQAPFKFRFFAFQLPPRQPHLCHFIPSLLLACLPVCLFASSFFFFPLLVVSCSCGIPFYDFPAPLLPSLLLSLLLSSASFHLSISLPLSPSSFAST